MLDGGWHGFDLDGTLAHYDKWVSAHHIGNPIPEMIKKIRNHLDRGEKVKIFTARVNTDDVDGDPENQSIRKAIQDWCLKHIGMILPITCVKDYKMISLYDDRAIQIIPNTGRSLHEHLSNEYVLVKASNLIAIRDALIREDKDEAYHLLYHSVEAKNPFDPWKEWEDKCNKSN